jgi:hypothetical protein
MLYYAIAVLYCTALRCAVLTFSCAEVMNRWSCISTSPYVFVVWRLIKHTDRFSFILCKIMTPLHNEFESKKIVSHQWILWIISKGSGVTSFPGLLVQPIRISSLHMARSRVDLRLCSHRPSLDERCFFFPSRFFCFLFSIKISKSLMLTRSILTHAVTSADVFTAQWRLQAFHKRPWVSVKQHLEV